MTQRVLHVFASDHPTAAGHFPGNPIIPGATILREIVQAVSSATGLAVVAIPSVKFLHPVRPGDVIAIAWTLRPMGVARFDCVAESNGTTLVTGALRMGSP